MSEEAKFYYKLEEFLEECHDRFRNTKSVFGEDYDKFGNSIFENIKTYLLDQARSKVGSPPHHQDL